MPLVAFLIGVVLWCLLYGSMSSAVLALLCIVCGVIFLFCGQHTHGDALSIDILAQHSRLGHIHVALKMVCCLILLFSAAFSRTAMVGIVLAGVTLVLTVVFGKVHLRTYITLLSVPLLFMLVSALALLWDWSIFPNGVLNIPFFHGYFVVSAAAQARAVLVLSRAFGAISCLYLLNLSTPLAEIIAVLRTIHLPNIITELMYLMYRYIFLLLKTFSTMKQAAESRLGYIGLAASLRTTGQVYGNLLARSFRYASSCFDAMESRCYDGVLRFLQTKKPLRMTHIICCVVLCTVFLIWSFL